MKKIDRAVRTRTGEAPLGVKIISSVLFVFCAFMLIGGTVLTIVGFFGINEFERNDLIQQAVAQNPSITSQELRVITLFLDFLGLFGIMIFIAGVIGTLVGLGLWNRKNSARIAFIAILCVLFVSSLLSLDVISVVISGLLIYYIGFSAECRKAFLPLQSKK